MQQVFVKFYNPFGQVVDTLELQLQEQLLLVIGLEQRLVFLRLEPQTLFVVYQAMCYYQNYNDSYNRNVHYNFYILFEIYQLAHLQIISPLIQNLPIIFSISSDHIVTYKMQSDIIKEQIQQLRHKQHIERITQTKQHQYQVAYCPQLTNSPYSHLAFTVKIILPTKYPEQPPRLFFVQQIHHLNIDSSTGAVRMPLLSDDWSPYLTLSSVFDSLDSLLEQPDLNYAVSAQMREQYIHQPQKYLHRIEQLNSLGQSIYQENAAQSFVQHVQIINQSKINDLGLHKQSSIPELEQSEPPFQNSVIISDVPQRKIIETSKDNNKMGKGNQIKIQSFSDIKQQAVEVSNILVKQKNIQEDVAPFSPTNLILEQREPRKKTEIVDKLQSVNKRSIVLLQQKSSPSEMDLQFDKIQQNLRRADSLLELLMIESNAMQDGIKKCQNGRLRSILEKKQQRIVQIFQQTLQLSSSLRERLFQRLKTETKRLLN